MNISIVIPCYNSKNSLPELVKRLKSTLQTSLLEIIFINDGSSDDTWNVIQKLQDEYTEVKGLNLMKNFGQHSALFCGINHASGDVVVTMDDDLQNPPEEILPMLNKLEEDSEIDVVIGVPKEPRKSLVRKLGSNYLNYITSKILDKPAALRMASFRVMRRRLVDEIKTNQTANPAFGSLLLNYTRNIVNIEVKNNERKYGESGYSLRKSIRLFLNNVLNNSTLPLRIASNIGISSSFVGLILAGFFLFKHLTGEIVVPGWTSLIVIMLFFFGLILFSLGVIGEYLIRILTEVNHSRQYVVKAKVGFGNNE